MTDLHSFLYPTLSDEKFEKRKQMKIPWDGIGGNVWEMANGRSGFGGSDTNTEQLDDARYKKMTGLTTLVLLGVGMMGILSCAIGTSWSWAVQIAEWFQMV